MLFDVTVEKNNMQAEIERLRDQNARLIVLLQRWHNIAVHGAYGDKTKFSLKSHPLTDDTQGYLKSIGC
jgi:hypothetical protein